MVEEITDCFGNEPIFNVVPGSRKGRGKKHFHVLYFDGEDGWECLHWNPDKNKFDEQFPDLETAAKVIAETYHDYKDFFDGRSGF